MFPTIPPVSNWAIKQHQPSKSSTAHNEDSLPNRTTASIAASVRIGNSKFRVGQTRTALSENEKRLLVGALHADMPKESFGEPDENVIATFVIGADDCFATVHLPKDLRQKMLVTCKLDPLMNLERVMISDVEDSKERPHLYCDAQFEPSPTHLSPSSMQEAESAHEVTQHGATMSNMHSQQSPIAARANFAAIARAGTPLGFPAFSDVPSLRLGDQSFEISQNRISATDDQIKAHLRILMER